jgi:hypothetical protein
LERIYNFGERQLRSPFPAMVDEIVRFPASFATTMSMYRIFWSWASRIFAGSFRCGRQDGHECYGA